MTNLRKPQTHQTQRVASSTLIVVGGVLLSFAIGLLRKRIIAGQFGTSFEIDAYSAVDSVSELFVTILASGTLVFAFMPLYIESLNGGERPAANQLASSVINFLALIAVVAAILVSVLAPTVVRSQFFGIGPGYPLDIQALMVNLVRISMIAMVIFSVSSFVTGILHAHGHFWLPALSPAAYSLGIIAGAYLLTPTLGIFGLAWGAVIGAVLHLTVQIPALIRNGFVWTPFIGLSNPTFWRVILLVLPRIGDLFLARVTLTLLAANLNSYLGEGRQSAMSYAYSLMNIPWTLVGTAIGFAIFPVMSASAATNDIEQQRKNLSGALCAVLVLIIPSAVGLLLFGRPLIQLLIENGKFTVESTNLAFYALQFYVIVLVSQSTLDIVVRAFAAQKDTLTPLLVSLFTTAINIGLALWLTRPWSQGGLEHGGPPFANGVAVGIESFIGLVILHFRWKGIEAKLILTYGAKACVAAAAMGGIVFILGKWLNSTPLIFLIVGGVVGVLVYGSVAVLLGIKEIYSIPNLIIQRARRSAELKKRPVGS